VIITGDVWSRARFRAIWDVHFGEARERLDAYRGRCRQRVELQAQDFRALPDASRPQSEAGPEPRDPHSYTIHSGPG
jgi:hypothetical protein